MRRWITHAIPVWSTKGRFTLQKLQGRRTECLEAKRGLQASNPCHLGAASEPASVRRRGKRRLSFHTGASGETWARGSVRRQIHEQQHRREVAAGTSSQRPIVELSTTCSMSTEATQEVLAKLMAMVACTMALLDSRSAQWACKAAACRWQMRCHYGSMLAGKSGRAPEHTAGEARRLAGSSFVEPSGGLPGYRLELA